MKEKINELSKYILRLIVYGAHVINVTKEQGPQFREQYHESLQRQYKQADNI